MGDLSMAAWGGAQEIVERRWSLDWSRRGIALSCVTRRALLEAPFDARPRRPRAAVIAGLLGCGALASAALASVPDADRGSRLVIAVPPTTKLAPPVAPARLAAVERKHKRPHAKQTTPAPSLERAEREAVAAAMEDGAMQEWQDHDGTTHYLVAGAVMEEGGLRCRDLSLLTRDAGGRDSVAQSRRCA